VCTHPIQIALLLRTGRFGCERRRNVDQRRGPPRPFDGAGAGIAKPRRADFARLVMLPAEGQAIAHAVRDAGAGGRDAPGFGGIAGMTVIDAQALYAFDRCLAVLVDIQSDAGLPNHDESRQEGRMGQRYQLLGIVEQGLAGSSNQRGELHALRRELSRTYNQLWHQLLITSQSEQF
jgi:hypothetical protein